MLFSFQFVNSLDAFTSTVFVTLEGWWIIPHMKGTGRSQTFQAGDMKHMRPLFFGKETQKLLLFIYTNRQLIIQ